MQSDACVAIVLVRKVLSGQLADIILSNREDARVFAGHHADFYGIKTASEFS